MATKTLTKELETINLTPTEAEETDGIPAVDPYIPEPVPPAPLRLPVLPTHPTCRSITAIIADLSRVLPDGCVATKTVKGTKIRYLHWQTVARLLDAYAPGWDGYPTRLEQHGATVRVTYRIDIPCLEGTVCREATGEDDEWEEKEETRYGNPSANAQANAFKRAAALFGCGQWLYDKPEDPTAQAMATYFKQEKQAALIDLGQALIGRGMDRQQALDWLKTQAGVTRLDHIPIAMIKTLLAYVIEHDKTDEFTRIVAEL